ncbi:MAG: MTAP family purine nucleoside phosphorylase [Armatimonadota bacterium]
MSRQLAVIGGSQAYSILESGGIKGERTDPIATPFGLSQPIYKVVLDDVETLFMSRHGERGYSIAAPWVNYRANIWALKEVGVTHIVSWSGPGAIDESLKVGQFVIPDDIIDETKAREYSFFKGTGWGFIRQNPVFCPSLSAVIASSLTMIDVEYRAGGIYVCTEGPRLETPAEIRKFRMFGGDMVGMTLVPEAFLAKELEMCYASICYITNYAEGIRHRPYKKGVLFEGLLDADEIDAVNRAVSTFPSIITGIASRIGETGPSCSCPVSMERYRRRGDIGSDWHTWIGT